MKLEIKKLDKALNAAYFKQNLKEEDIVNFKNNVTRLFKRLNENESEEHNKNIVSDFLKKTYYEGSYEMNTADRKDLVIHKGNTSQTPVAIIIEAKSPANKTEMIGFDKPNAKAFHETIHYYLHERLVKGNNEIKHIIITNSYNWFIFDATDFEKYFYENKSFRNSYQDWHDKKLVGNTTEWFYNEIAKPYIETEIELLECVYINLQSFTNLEGIENDSKLINLYKILSPEHLLKLPFANDYNKIDPGFYNELLYILGLEETKDSGKKIITRIKAKNRQDGSLLENTINYVVSKKQKGDFDNSINETEDNDDLFFSIGLELCITWLNRILFLKLLEAQLVKFHRENTDYLFLNLDKISDFSELDELFFEVMAVSFEKRNKAVVDKFGNIPYLNSSLFDPTEFEQKYCYISGLKKRFSLPIYASSVLKDQTGKRKTGELNTLEYIFEFLNAYNFSSDTKAEIQKDNKTIINAAVLGLIFEKLNGYKDGSFYTPSFITTYISRETLKSTIIQKFKTSNLQGFKNLEGFHELKDKIDYSDKEQRNKANEIINSIKVCDPAVGSGHFLVSILNELVAIKSELKILQTPSGTRLKGIVIKNINDELEIVLEETGESFQYFVNDKHLPINEIQEIQETLFNEKRILIEKCLFGVDINPKSVLICRLRLWIELLKSSYYTSTSQYKYLETLPNIDMNIVAGNSLISFFEISGNGHSTSEKKKIQKFTQEYKTQVVYYKDITEKKEKSKTKEYIQTIKKIFMGYAKPKDKEYIELQKLNAEFNTMPIFFSKEEKKEWDKKQIELGNKLLILENKLNEISNTVYRQAFEWRFEFPEVLNAYGIFEGFDVIVGNPPYIDYREIDKHQLSYLSKYEINYKSPRPSLYQFFIERAYHLLKPGGVFCFINPNQFLSTDSGYGTRKFLLEKTKILFIDDISHLKVFENAATYTVIFAFEKSIAENYTIRYNKAITEQDLGRNQTLLHKNEITKSEKLYIISNSNKELIEKIENDSSRLGNICNMAWGTSQSGYGKKKILKPEFEKLHKDKQKKYAPILQTRDIKNYFIEWKQEYIPREIFSDNIIKLFNADNKLLVARMTLRLQAAIDTNKCFVGKSTIVSNVSDNIDLKYLLALLNSRLISFWYANYFENTHMAGGYIRFDIPYLKQIPIKIAVKTEQQNIIKKVDAIIRLKNENPTSDTSKYEIELNQLVYKLYDLTEEEIKIVEK